MSLTSRVSWFPTARIHETLNPSEMTAPLQGLPDLALAGDLLEEIRGYDGTEEPEDGEEEDWSLRYHPDSFKMRKIGGPARDFPNAVVDYELVPSYDPVLVAEILRAAVPRNERFIAERIILRGGGPVDIPDVPAATDANKGDDELPEYDWSPRVWRLGGERLKPAAFVADLRHEATLSAVAPPASGAPPRAPRLTAVQPAEISTGSGAPLVSLAKLREEERWEEEMEALEAEIRLQTEMQELGKVVVEEMAAEKEMLLCQEIEAEMAEQGMDAVETRLVAAVWGEIAALKECGGILPCSFGVALDTMALSG